MNVFENYHEICKKKLKLLNHDEKKQVSYKNHSIFLQNNWIIIFYILFIFFS